jgi:LytS/YehU family sensor histidine kinase
MALENIRHRLQALYGEEARVDARPLDDQYEVVVSYPLRKKDARQKNGVRAQGRQGA